MATEPHVSSRDVDQHIETLKQCKIISEDSVKALCEKAKEILMEESNVHHVPVPAVVVSGRARGAGAGAARERVRGFVVVRHVRRGRLAPPRFSGQCRNAHSQRRGR